MLNSIIKSAVFSVLVLLQIAAHGQGPFDANKAIQSLLESKLVSQEESESLRTWVQSGKTNYSLLYSSIAHPPIQSRAGILLSLACLRGDSVMSLSPACYELANQSLTTEEIVRHPIAQGLFIHRYGLPIPGVDFFNGDFNYPMSDSVAVRQKKLSQKLFSIGLLDAQVMQYQPTVTDFNPDLSQYYYHMSTMCRYVDEFASIREGEIRKCRNLVEAGVLTQDEFNHMQLDYISYQLMGDFGILGHSSKGLALEADSLPDDLVPYLESMGQQMLSRMPVKGATHFRVKEEYLDYPWDFFEYESGKQYVAYLDLDGKTYAQEFVLYDYGLNLERLAFSDFRNLFNKVLAESSSEYRLYALIPSDIYGVPEPGRMGFVFLTSAQQRAWQEEMYGSDDLLSFYSRAALTEENHSDAFSPSRVAGVYNDLESAGLLDHLDESEREKTWDLISKSTIECVGDMVLLIPNLMHLLPMELDMNAGAPYAKLLAQLSEFSGGEFKPTKIKDNYSKAKEGEEFTVSFKLGKKHSITLRKEYEWIDTAFFPFVERASGELPGRQFHLGQNGAGIMMITPAQFQLLERIAPELLFEMEWD